MAEPIDHKRLIDLLEAYLLGEEPSLTGQELADEVGIPFELRPRPLAQPRVHRGGC